MKSVLLLILFLLISSGFGRVLLNRFTVLSSAPLERFAYGTAIGFGVGALGVFALGMVGLLSFTPITVWWALLAVIGLPGTLHNLRDLFGGLGRRRPSRLFPSPNGSTDLKYLKYTTLIAPAAILVLFATGLFCICACFQPPTGHEWDVLAYHLADPKVFLAQNRISMLPTQHHSNFPFLMEMLYCVGLLYDNFPLANLFHLTMGMLTVVAVLGFCRRTLPGHVGWIAVLLLVTTPLYLWECCVAYVEVGMGLYITLAAFAGIMLIETAREDTADAVEIASPDRQRRLREWALLAGIALGFALGIKYLALIPFALVPLLLVYRRAPMRQVLLVVGVAAVIGCPWYVKNIIVTHNPVYPFLFKLFPASKYWSADRAAAYQSEQGGFGFPHSLAYPGRPANDSHPADNLFQTVNNLFETPWHLLTAPQLFTNPGDFHFMALMGGLYAAGIFPLVFLRRIPRPVVNLLLLFGGQLLIWFFAAQISRYLISLLPLAAVIAAYGLSAISRLDRPPSRQAARNLRLFPTVATLILTGQVLLMAWALVALPTVPKFPGEMTTPLVLGDVLKNATEPDTWDEYLKHKLDNYAAIDWINRNTPKTEGVILYDEPRGFYLDRPYLWGNLNHSSYIPYEQMKDGNDLTVWLRQHGYHYVLINLNWSPHREAKVNFNGEEKGEELEYLRKWYEEDAMPGTWSFLLADAMRHRLWTPTAFYGHGVVVLEIVGGEDGSGGVPPGAGRNVP